MNRRNNKIKKEVVETLKIIGVISVGVIICGTYSYLFDWIGFDKSGNNKEYIFVFCFLFLVAIYELYKVYWKKRKGKK